MEQVRNGKMVRDAKPLSAWKRSVMATSVAAVLACVGMPAYAQKVSCDSPQTPTPAGMDGTACGAHTVVSGAEASAFGSYAEATATRATAVGREAKAQAVNTVTLAGANGTRIGNVAPGELGASSMDAINGSQLYQSMTQVAAMLGGGATMTAQGFTAPSYLIQNATYNDVGSALHALDTAVTNIGRPPFGKNDLEGYTHGKAGGLTAYGEGGASSTALGVNAHAIGVEHAVAVGESAIVGAEYGTALGQNASVTAEGAVALGHNSAADRADTVSVGSKGAERQVVNVADATQGTDAINKRQLDRGVASANSYTDARVNALTDSFDLFQGAVDERLRKQDRRIDRQGAMNAAMMNMAMSAAGIHTENRVGVGVGFQGGQSAMSLGYQRALSERATITFGGAFSSDDSSVGLGAGFGW